MKIWACNEAGQIRAMMSHDFRSNSSLDSPELGAHPKNAICILRNYLAS